MLSLILWNPVVDETVFHRRTRNPKLNVLNILSEQTNTIEGRACKNCEEDSHHFLLCPAKKAMTALNMAKNTPASSYAGQLKKSSVLLQAQFVTSLHGFKIGTLLNLGSTDNYVTHKFAKR